MHPLGKASDGCLDKDAAQEPMATLPPASLFILTPEEPGAWAKGSRSEVWRASLKAGQSWTPLLHCWEHLFTRVWCPQPPSSMRKGPCTLAIYSGSGLLASNEGQGHYRRRTWEEKALPLFPRLCVGTGRAPPPCKSCRPLHHHLAVKRALAPSPEEDGLFRVLTTTGLSQGTFPCVLYPTRL